MIIVICTMEKDPKTGKPRKIVSHGIDHATGKSVCLSCEAPEDIGAVFDPEFGEYVLRNEPSSGKPQNSAPPQETLYYPCIIEPRSGRISKKVGGAMSKDRAEDLLKVRYPALWRSLEAIPQPVGHHYFA